MASIAIVNLFVIAVAFVLVVLGVTKRGYEPFIIFGGMGFAIGGISLFSGVLMLLLLSLGVVLIFIGVGVLLGGDAA